MSSSNASVSETAPEMAPGRAHGSKGVPPDAKSGAHPIDRRVTLLAGAIITAKWTIAVILVAAFYIYDRDRAAGRLGDALVIAQTQVEAELVPIHAALDETVGWLNVEDLLPARPLRATELAKIRERLNTLKIALPAGTGLGVVDASGQLIASIPAMAEPMNLSQSGFFRALAEHPGARAVLGEPRIGKLASGMRMPLAVRVARADGSFGGVLFASVAYSHLADAIEQLSSLSHTCLVLRGENGERVVRAGAPACDVAPIRPGDLANAPRPGSVTRGEHAFLAVAKQLPIGDDLHLELSVYADKDEVFVYFRYARWLLVAVSIAFTLFVMGLAKILLKEFARREALAVEMKAHESGLATQRTELVEAQRIASLGSWTCDIATGQVEPSAEYLAILGFTEETYPRTTDAWIDRLVDPEHKEEARRNFNLMRRGQPYEGTRKITLPNGMQRWVQFKCVPFHDDTGKHIGHRGVLRDITEERAARDTLARRTAELETAKRIAGLGAWTWDAETDALTVDDYALQMYEVERADAPDTLLSWGLRFVHPDDVEEYRGMYTERFGGEPIDIVRRAISGKGRLMWIHTLGTPAFDGDGKLTAYYGVSRDITEQKTAEHRLAESEQKYRLITENMRDIVAIYDEDSALLFATPSLTSTLGYKVEDAIGRRAAAAIHRADFGHVRAALRALAAGETEAANVWFRYPHAAGHWVWLESVVVPFRSEEGRVRYQATTREITLRKQAEFALRASEERFRSLTELSSDWYWEQDPQYRFTFMSRERTRWTNKSRSELLGHTRWEAYPNALTPEEWAAHRADLDARRPFYNLVVKVLDPDTGKVRAYSSLNGQPVFDDGGRFIGYRGTGQDITARKFAEDALARRTRELALSNKWLEEEARERQLLEKNFLMAIEMELAQVGLELHDDLGQDLTGIALLTKTLERRLAEAGIPAAADAARISELTNRAIRHTRMISHGLSPYIWGTEGLVAALAQLAGDINSLGEVECHADLDKDIVIAEEVVARNLYRIAQESVNNALKHGRAKRITLTLSQTARNLNLTVTDDGIGHAERAPDGNAEMKFHSLRHRANSINAKLSIRRGRRGGTVVRVSCAHKLDFQRPLPLLENA